MMLGRAALGALAAALVAFAAWRTGALARSGAAAAVVAGTASVAAGWGWGTLLLFYFVSSALLSRLGGSAKRRRTVSVVEKGGPRDARQVIANGGVFVVLALASAAFSSPAACDVAAAGALGALGAAAADTWATEVGTITDAPPRSLRGWRPVAPGTSGAVSAAGTMALLTGAVVFAWMSRMLALSSAGLAVIVGGVSGAAADSALGVALQERRWCPACERDTERRVHDCGARTSRAGGIAWLDNDVVNFAATLAGALVSAGIVLATARAPAP